MGQNDRELNKKDGRREKAREKRESRRGASEPVDFMALDWILLACLTAEMAKAGGAVRLGLTRDGGAVAIGMYLDDDYATEYIRPSEVFQDAVADIARAWLPDGGEAWFEGVLRAREGTK